MVNTYRVNYSCIFPNVTKGLKPLMTTLQTVALAFSLVSSSLGVMATSVYVLRDERAKSELGSIVK